LRNSLIISTPLVGGSVCLPIKVASAAFAFNSWYHFFLPSLLPFFLPPRAPSSAECIGILRIQLVSTHRIIHELGDCFVIVLPLAGNASLLDCQQPTPQGTQFCFLTHPTLPFWAKKLH
jgi:hypothetical protein